MKKTIISTLIAGGLILSATSAMAGGVGFANVQDIFEQSSLGKAKVTADEQKLKPQMDELKKTITALQDKVNSYEEMKDEIMEDNSTDNTVEAKKDVAAEAADKTQAEADLEKAMGDYQALMTEVQKMASDDADAFRDSLTKASASVSKTKNLDAILPAEMSLYNKDGLDVTKEIIAQMK